MTVQLGQLSLITDPLGSLKIDRQPSDCTEEYCFIPGNGAHVCWIEETYMVIHINGITLNTAKLADQYYSSYSYQSSFLISYLMFNDLHHDCKPYKQNIYFSVSLYSP